jgi:hypothetical protein
MSRKKLRAYCAAGCGRRANTAVAKYCSIRCEHVDKHNERVRLLEGGLYPPSLRTSAFLRRYLKERIGEKCSRCGWCKRHPKTGRVMVEVEHIDGDWRNNLPSNLTLLCPNCHSLTPTFRALNRGRGRPARRKAGRLQPESREESRAPRLEVPRESCSQADLWSSADVA